MLPSSLPAHEQRPTPPLNWKIGVAIVVMLMVFCAAFGVSAIPSTMLGGQIRAFVLSGMNVIPFVMLAVLAYIGSTRDWGKVLTLVWLVILVGGLALNNVTNAFFGLLSEPWAPSQSLPPLVSGGATRVTLITVLSVGAMVVGALGFIPAVRRALRHVLSIDPTSFVHTIALVSIVTTTLLCLIPLVVLAAPPTLLLIANQPQIGESVTEGAGVSSLIYQLIWALPGALLAVGYAVRRDLGTAVRRLGFVWPTVRQIGLGIGVAIALVVAVQIVGTAIERIWTQFGWPQTDAEAFEQLLEGLLNPFGAVVIGVVAGISEELAVRGVLQPRLGILLSNLFFTSVHALQYNWDNLLVVFIVGMAFGVLRQRTNTTTSAITHGVYNFTLVMLSVLVQG